MKEKGHSVFLAAAMNTSMWEHPITLIQLKQLESFGYNVIMPIGKKLACGDIGKIFLKRAETNNNLRNRRHGQSRINC